VRSRLRALQRDRGLGDGGPARVEHAHAQAEDGREEEAGDPHGQTFLRNLSAVSLGSFTV
jgi:hypothetical protein